MIKLPQLSNLANWLLDFIVSDPTKRHALFELARTIVLGAVAAFVTQALPFFEGDVDKSAKGFLIFVVLKGLDKWLHESGTAKFGIARI